LEAATEHNGQARAELAGTAQCVSGCFRIDLASHFRRIHCFRTAYALSSFIIT
jgi:hypothetical protein